MKYGVSLVTVDVISAGPFEVIVDGNSAAPVRYETIPAKTVDPYAISTVRNSILLAERPTPEIAEIIKPNIIRGTAKPRN